MSAPVHDQDARERIERDLDSSLLVEAAAGTGKTTMLVRRLVAVLEHGRATIDGVVAVTFTRKAAGELKLRLRQALDTRRASLFEQVEVADASARITRLETALARLEEAHIGTIHGFCAEVLRRHPVAAGIDPSFAEVDEDESARLYDRAFQRFIEHRLDDLPEGLRRALSRLALERTFDGASPLDRLREAGRGLIDWRDFPVPWSRRPFARTQQIDTLVEQVAQLTDAYRASSNRHDYLRRALEAADGFTAWVESTEEAAGAGAARAPRDYDSLEARLIELLRALRKHQHWKGRGRSYAANLTRQEVAALRDATIERLAAFKEAADADLAALLRTELGEVTDAYEARKRKRGRLDFLDLLLRTRDLVRDHTAIRRGLQQRFSHIFVDEFQDTDPLQAEILLLLSADDPALHDWREARPRPGTLFLVGDPKQSIYRFRRADVVLYQTIQEQLAGVGVDRVTLSTNFRSTAPLQEAINAAFAPHMQGDREAGQPAYVPLRPFRDASSEPPPAQPSLVAIPAPTPYSYSRVTQWQIDQCLPDTVAAWIAWLVRDSGFTVTDPATGERVPVRPRHVAVLFRRFLSWHRDVSQPYVRALEARDVPHLLIGGRSFHQREEIEALRAALTAVEWPDDELAVFATLKGPLFSVDDDLLLRFRTAHGTLHPFAPMPDDLDPALMPITDTLGLLARLHRRRNRVPIAETVRQLLAATRAHVGFALRPAGQQVLANVQRIRDLARAFERRGGLSFRGFVDRLTAESGHVGSTYAPVLEEGADGVRMLTVHAAKGLEFPVVVLADITARLTPFEVGQHVDPTTGLYASRLLGCSPWELLEQAERERARDTAEGVRLAYVAATRARDLLAVPGIGDGPWHGGWTSPLDDAIYPAKGAYRESQAAPGCPAFGERTVLMRPQRFDGEPEASVKPGLHTPASGGSPVVWWDPEQLERNVTGRVGLHQEAILTPEETGSAEQEGQRAHRSWQVARSDALARGGRPSRSVHAASDTAAGEPPDLFLLDIQVETVPRQADRPRGNRFGSLVHAVLGDVPLDGSATPETIGDLTALHGRVLLATAREIEAATAVVEASLAHPVLQQAATAERIHRETPFSLALEPVPLDDDTDEANDAAERVIEGTIDLAFRDAGGEWVVVDFKTDADTTSLDERYRAQIGWYVVAMQRLSGGHARGILLAL